MDLGTRIPDPPQSLPRLLQDRPRMELSSSSIFILLLLLLLSGPSEVLAGPCANGGTAVGDGCVCPPGHSGPLCLTSDPASACRNGGTAVGTSCYCPPGFGGPRCQHPDPATACHNGATPFGTRCVCPPGFRGDTCRDAEEPGSCLNGGTLDKGTCRCPPTAWGPRCECAVAAGRALYVNDTAGTNATTVGGDTVTATTVGGDTAEGATDTPPGRRERNVTAGPAEGNVTAVMGSVTTVMGSVTKATSNGRAAGRNVTVTAVVSANADRDVVTTMGMDTEVSANTDHDVISNTDHDVVTPTVVRANTDHDVVTTTEMDTELSANTDHDVIASMDHDVVTPTVVRANTDHDVVTTMEMDTEVSANTDHDVIANTDHDVVTTTEKDTRSVPTATTAGDNTTMVPPPVPRARNVTALPVRSHSRATTMEGDTTAVEGDTVVTSNPVEGDTTVTPSNPVEGDTTAMEGDTTVTEGDTTATEGDTEATLMAGGTEATRATTAGSDTVAVLPGHVGSHSRATTRARTTTAMGDNSRATTLEGDTGATTLKSDTRATTMESDTRAMPMITMGGDTRAVGNNTTATTVEGDTMATTLEGDTGATTLKSDTRATTMESDTTAMENTRATTVKSDTGATTLKSDTGATTPDSHTLSTLPVVPANVTSTPALPGATNTTLGVTETPPGATNTPLGVTETPPSATNTTLGVTETPPNATEATGALGHGSARTVGDILTSTATSVVTAVATICLYLPHGSSPPAIVCHNGGVANLTRCLCPPGYSGPTCETPDPKDLCAHGSTAVGDLCVCPPGRAGPRCATPDPATACLHGGTAVGTRCYCPRGFSGPRCEQPETTGTTTRPTRRTRRTTTTTRPTRRTRGTTTTTRPTRRTRGTTTTTRPTRRTRRTTTTVPTTTRDPCLNGGRWTGTSCLCPPNMDGPRCQFGATTINLTAELGPFVTMMARVTNREFSEDMADAASPGHRRFAREFGRTMDGIYRNVSGYRGVNVLSLSRGSVVVNYRVRLLPVPGNASLEHRALELLALANAAPRPHDCSPSADGLCFTATSARATRAAAPALNDTELCRRHAPANFSQFYFPHRTANGLLCVTNCTLNVPGSFDCHRGLCRLTLDGPQCFCPDLPWYLSSGDRCQTHISKLGLGLGVGLGLGLTILILLILCIVLAVHLARGRKKSPGASSAAEDVWPDGGRNGRVTGIYHVNGAGTGPYGHNTYKPSSEVAEPPASVLAEGAAAL